MDTRTTAVHVYNAATIQNRPKNTINDELQETLRSFGLLRQPDHQTTACIQAITNYRTTPPACDSDASLPDALNYFYARFKTQNSVAARKTTPPPNNQVLCLTAADLRKTLRRVNLLDQTTFLFAYRPNRSTDDAISTTLHLALTHLDNRDTYVRMLFIDFSSAFNTIIPQHLIGKLNLLGLNTSLCNWIQDFLTGRPQSVRIRHNTSSTTTLSTGASQGCVLSPLLFNLLTHDCAAMHSSNHIIKFADDTTVIVKSTKFLGVHLAEDPTWSLNTSTITKKAHQSLYFLRSLRKAHLPPPILTTFYRGTIESILSSCITAWFGNCTTSDRKSLQRVVSSPSTKGWHINIRPHEGGLRARRPVVGTVLTGQHRRARLAFATEHQNWQIGHRRLVLFTDESRFYLSTCDRVIGSGDAVENVMPPATSFSMTGLVVGQ
ncbi:hypothetical protein NFI96_007034 [Prochilodus magdalenae]|nr:hypothetical protein NFI96_007034 [Prochilodus magdalenae]